MPSTGAFGSVVLALIANSGVVIATDSLVSRSDGGSPRTECKLERVREKVAFAATGMGRFQQPMFDPYALAVNLGANEPLSTATEKYRDLAAPAVQRIWDDIRTAYLLRMGRADGPLDRPISAHTYVFAGIDNDGVAVMVGGAFTEQPRRRGVLTFEKFELRPAKDDYVFIWRSGTHEAIPIDALASQLINRVGGPEAVKQLIEVQLRAAPQLVGGPVSVLTIPVTGTRSWYSPGACNW